MLKKVSNIPFKGTKEQEEKLKKVIDDNKHDKSLLMYVMQQAQEIYGYLPLRAVFAVAEGRGQYFRFLGTACYVKGSQKILDKITEILGIEPGECTSDGRFSLEACRCIGACGLAPVMTVNDEVFGKLVPEDVPGILAKYGA